MNLHSGTRARVSQCFPKYIEKFLIPCKFIVLHMLLCPHRGSSRLRKIHSIGSICIQEQHSQGQWVLEKEEYFWFHQVFKLTSANKSCVLFIRASLSTVPRQHALPLWQQQLCLPWYWWTDESVKLVLTGFALLEISGMNSTQNMSVMFPNLRLQGLVYMSEVVYFCCLNSNPLYSSILQSFRVQAFLQCSLIESQRCNSLLFASGKKKTGQKLEIMCQKPNMFTNMNTYHLHKITCTKYINLYIRNIYKCIPVCIHELRLYIEFL